MRRMTPMIAALALGASTAVASAATTFTDPTLADSFEIERAIVDRAQQVFGETAVFESPEELPAGIDDAIVAGNVLPASTPTEAVPAELGELPKLIDNSRWVAAGNHLVEVTPDNRIVMVVYDALP